MIFYLKKSIIDTLNLIRIYRALNNACSTMNSNISFLKDIKNRIFSATYRWLYGRFDLVSNWDTFIVFLILGRLWALLSANSSNISSFSAILNSIVTDWYICGMTSAHTYTLALLSFNISVYILGVFFMLQFTSFTLYVGLLHLEFPSLMYAP
jgi:hypothetical protein